MRDVVARFTADHDALARRYDAPGSPDRLAALRGFTTAWQTKLGTIDFGSLSVEGRIDWILLQNRLAHDLRLLDREQKRLSGNGAAHAVCRDRPGARRRAEAPGAGQPAGGGAGALRGRPPDREDPEGGRGRPSAGPGKGRGGTGRRDAPTGPRRSGPPASSPTARRRRSRQSARSSRSGSSSPTGTTRSSPGGARRPTRRPTRRSKSTRSFSARRSSAPGRARTNPSSAIRSGARPSCRTSTPSSFPIRPSSSS